MNDQNIYFALGFAWLCAASVRLLTILFGAYSIKNLAGVAVDLLIACLCPSSVFT